MKYPNNIIKVNKTISYGNRGMNLEYLINSSNEYYKSTNRAIIYKKPTPITVVKVDYPSRYEAKIVEAYYKTPSTTDYNGIYRGKYIDFEAKETTKKNGFPLINIHKHQIDHLNMIMNHGGIGFLIIYFSTLNIVYYLDGKDLMEFLKTNKKTIPLLYLEEKGFVLKNRINPYIDYLKIIDDLYFKEI